MRNRLLLHIALALHKLILIFVDSSDFDQHAVTTAPKGPVRKRSKASLSPKAEARKDYVREIMVQRDSDKAWKWLYDLGIPCHDMKIRVWPHTKPPNKVPEDGEGGKDTSGGGSSKDTYAPQ